MSHGQKKSICTLFFSPETARFERSDDPPRELEAKISTFDEIKKELKRELRDLVVAEDPASSTHRTRALGSSPRRSGHVMRRWKISVRKFAAASPRWLLRDQNVLMLAVAKKPPPKLSPGRTPLEQLQRIREMVAVRAEEFDRKNERFHVENADRHAALAEQAKSIKADLLVFAGTEIDPAIGKPMDPGDLLRLITATDQQFAKIGRKEAICHDYRVAMIEPGLSPAQRRLLFGAAVTALAQPLPNDDRMPAGPFPNVGFRRPA